MWNEGHLFECTCTRADIAAAVMAPQEGDTPRSGPDGIIYPGTCRGRTRDLSDSHASPDGAIRLDMARARPAGAGRRPDSSVLSFRESGYGPEGEHGLIEFTADDLIRGVGDVVLARRGLGTSYHLSVVLDDAAQGITHVVRGQDLFEATKIHVVLQKLLGLPTPEYYHHRLIRDETGRRLAKREDAKAIRRYRDEGATPKDIRRMVGL
jgi:glutamyl-Q tRNA(Asp) synthetase